MRAVRHIASVLLLILSVKMLAAVPPAGRAGVDATADSIVARMIALALDYERRIESYQAQLYIKGKYIIHRKNGLVRYVPSMFKLRKGVKEYIVETLNDLHYTAPNIYDQRVKVSTGTTSRLWEVDGRLPEFFHVNIYSSSLLDDKLVSPLAKNAAKYYTYSLDSIEQQPATCYVVSFKPKFESYQLLSGYMKISQGAWSVREMRLEGRSEMWQYSSYIRMGEVGSDSELLPNFYDMDIKFGLLGNKIEGMYTASLQYQDILTDDDRRPQAVRRDKHDLTESYTLRTDNNLVVHDYSYIDSLRPVDLSPEERRIYEAFQQQQDTALQDKKVKNRGQEFIGSLGDVLLSQHTVDLKNVGSVRCSPLINPLMLSYSHTYGLSYRQKFKYNCLFSGDRLLRISPRIGYNFRQHEFYWSAVSDFYYRPQSRSAIHLDIGNGNRIYNNRIMEELKQMYGESFDYTKISLNHFKDFYTKALHSWEITNGLTLDVGVSVHHRTLAAKSKPLSTIVKDKNVSEQTIISLSQYEHDYNSFAPEVRISWTPGMYYYMNGRRKVNLRSKYPTFSLDWERGIKGVMNHSSNYERFEGDVQQTIRFDFLRSLYLRFGGGYFTNKEELYFVDFENLRRQNLPLGWNDDIGGVFQLLDGYWYNSSREYLRGHVTYEAPFLFVTQLKKHTQFILNERLYLNALLMQRLKPYIEVGYGIGTHIFDFGLFGSFINGKYHEVGCKFTFELFDK